MIDIVFKKDLPPPITFLPIKEKYVTRRSSLMAQIGMNTMGVYLMHYYLVLLIPKGCDSQIRESSMIFYLLVCVSLSLVITFLCMMAIFVLKKYKISRLLMLGIIK